MFKACDKDGNIVSQKHRALDDVELTQLVFERIKEIILDSELEDLDDLVDLNSDVQLLTIEEIVYTLRSFDILLQQYDKEIVDYLTGKTKFKKDLIAAAPKIPDTIEFSIFSIYKNKHTLDKSKFKRLLSIARKRLNEYRLNMISFCLPFYKALFPQIPQNRKHRALIIRQKIIIPMNLLFFIFGSFSSFFHFDDAPGYVAIGQRS